MKLPKLIIADIDDTMSTKGYSISPLLRQTLNELHDMGVMFCPASGRPLDEVERSAEDFGLNFEPEFVIGMNGGEILDRLQDERLIRCPLDSEVLEQIITLLGDRDCNIYAYKNGKLYTKELEEKIIRSAARAGKELYVPENISEFYDAPIGKLMFRTSSFEQCDELEDWCKGLNIPGVIFFKTQPDLLEVCDERLSKGAALEYLCKEHGLEPDGVIAFGDASNDNGMLEYAGCGVCLANGLPDTKAIADFITEKDCANDGMAWWLREQFSLDD